MTSHLFATYLQSNIGVILNLVVNRGRPEFNRLVCRLMNSYCWRMIKHIKIYESDILYLWLRYVFVERDSLTKIAI